MRVVLIQAEEQASRQGSDGFEAVWLARSSRIGSLDLHLFSLPPNVNCCQQAESLIELPRSLYVLASGRITGYPDRCPKSRLIGKFTADRVVKFPKTPFFKNLRFSGIVHLGYQQQLSAQ